MTHNHDNISIIVAVATNGAIGIGGDMPYHISADLRHFKTITSGHTVVMGRKTFQSLPGGALPNRRNIVITRSADTTFPGAERAGSLKEAIEMAAADGEIMIIGGAEIYRQALPLASTLYLTRIHATPPEADTFFPLEEVATWVETDRSEIFTDPKTGIQFQFLTLHRP